MFLGDSTDYGVELEGATFRSRQHPSVALRRGDAVWVELPVDTTVALSAEDSDAAVSDHAEDLSNSWLDSEQGQPV